MPEPSPKTPNLKYRINLLKISAILYKRTATAWMNRGVSLNCRS